MSPRESGSNEFWEFSTLMTDNSQPPPAIIGEGILLRECLLLISGPPKVKKSFLAANLAISLAHGRSFAGFKIESPQRVMLISAEGGRTPNKKRLQQMWHSWPSPQIASGRFHGTFAWTQPLDSQEGENELKAALACYTPDVLILDPLVRFHQGEENSATDMGRFFRLLRGMMKESHFAVILIHHSGKNPEQGARGSSAIHAEYDSAIQMKKDGDGAVLVFDLRHEDTPANRTLRFNTETLWFEAVSENIIVQLLRKCGSAMSKKELTELIVAKGVTKSTGYAYKLISQAKKGGLLEEKDGKFHVAMQNENHHSPVTLVTECG